MYSTIILQVHFQENKRDGHVEMGIQKLSSVQIMLAGEGEKTMVCVLVNDDDTALWVPYRSSSCWELDLVMLGHGTVEKCSSTALDQVSEHCHVPNLK